MELQNHSPYAPFGAAQCAARYRRRTLGMRAAYLGVTAPLAIWLILGHEERWGLLGAWAAGMGLIFLLAALMILAISYENLCFLRILYVDCDPLKLQQALTILMPHMRRRERRSLQLSYALCCGMLHQYDAMEQALAGVPQQKGRPVQELVRINLGMNHAFALRDAAGLAVLRARMDELARQYGRGRRFAQQLPAVCRLMETYQALLAGDLAAARRSAVQYSCTAMLPLSYIGGCLLLARMDLQQGERANARARLEYAAAFGATTAAAAEARILLAQEFPAAAEKA